MLLALLKTMRPRQWAKNAAVFVTLVFDSKLFDPLYLSRTAIAFVLLCLLASAVYIVNDIADIEKDRLHPKKRFRPLAAGSLSKNVAVAAAALFLVAALGGGFALHFNFGILAALYLVVNLLYSFWLKNVVIVDVLLVASGFVIRVGAGTVLVDAVRFSPWLYVCTTLLSLFILLGKRRHEISILSIEANNHRPVLANYNHELLDQMIGIVTTCAIIAYSFYTFSAENLPENHAMMLTVPFVLYGIFRYLYLIHVQREGGAPDELLFRDRPLLIAVALWVISVVGILYFGQ
ncbi:MAG: decaprenyl-phosphate phosphoribosyltransferase [Chloroflexi bacterium]|nr:decaprenyl-phosphate phosphoribosyltransferase [Chloroflexota bacterium]